MPPGPGVAEQAAPAASPPPRSPHHRGNGAAAVTPQSPLRIRQDGKFYERLLTKESSTAGNLSFRYYWAEPAAVPFVWESQPGTPKDVALMAAAAALPAITPPPSYLLRHHGGIRQAARHDHKMTGGKKKRRCRLKRIRIGFIAGFFRRLGLGKAASWRRPATPPVKVSSASTRWLFSSVATEAGDHNNNLHRHDDEIAAARATKPQHKTAPCSLPPAPLLLRFCSSYRSRGGGGIVGTCGWA